MEVERSFTGYGMAPTGGLPLPPSADDMAHGAELPELTQLRALQIWLDGFNAGVRSEKLREATEMGSGLSSP